jgi:hypothetical protein
MRILRFTFVLFLSTLALVRTANSQEALSPEDQQLFEQGKCVIVVSHLESAVRSLSPQEKSKTAGEILYQSGIVTTHFPDMKKR